MPSGADDADVRGPAQPDDLERPHPGSVTLLLREQRAGAAGASDRLFAAVYPELRRVARALMRRERPGHTLQPTELVHDAFFRLVDQTAVQDGDRMHFVAVAARAMRQILVDHARRRDALKRGEGWERITLHEGAAAGGGEAVEILAVDQALERLAREDARAARVVELKVFGGLTSVEIASLLGVSKRTVDGDWALGRLWIARAIAREP